MILEAFSEHLKAHNQPLTSAMVADALLTSAQKPTPTKSHSREVLFEWLNEQLHVADAEDHVTRVIQAELALVVYQGQPFVTPITDSGRRLLDTLEHYCDSYDHWQFSRWLHVLEPGDFETAC